MKTERNQFRAFTFCSFEDTRDYKLATELSTAVAIVQMHIGWREFGECLEHRATATADATTRISVSRASAKQVSNIHA